MSQSQRTETVCDLSFQKYLFTVSVRSQIFLEPLLGTRSRAHSGKHQTARPLRR